METTAVSRTADPLFAPTTVDESESNLKNRWNDGTRTHSLLRDGQFF